MIVVCDGFSHYWAAAEPNKGIDARMIQAYRDSDVNMFFFQSPATGVASWPSRLPLSSATAPRMPTGRQSAAAIVALPTTCTGPFKNGKRHARRLRPVPRVGVSNSMPRYA